MTRHSPRRPPAVAGSFYPESTAELRDCVERLLRKGAESAETAETAGECKAVIAPHAGYRYSGPVAGSAFRPWAHEEATSASPEVNRIVVIGPSHHVDFEGIALPESSVFETPLGSIDVDPDAESTLKNCPFLKRFEPAHAREHAIEVELPFLQHMFGSFRLVPLVVGRADDEAVGETIDRLWGGPETRLVISSDLSHYLDANAAAVCDCETADLIESGCYERLTADRACGFRAIRGFLCSRNGRQLLCRRTDLRHSGDTGGSRDRVVGYGAFQFWNRNRDRNQSPSRN